MPNLIHSANDTRLVAANKKRVLNVGPRAVPTRAVFVPQIRPNSAPYSPNQELKPFCKWIGGTTWVPPKDATESFAATLLRNHRPWVSDSVRWSTVLNQHRDTFTAVREIELAEPSIRLPRGRLLVTVTEQKDFDKITDVVPACVQTRLDEFLAGPGRRADVRVFYLKPLCIEVNDELIFTSGKELEAAVTQVQESVFREHRRLFLRGLPRRMVSQLVKAALVVPTTVGRIVLERRRRALQAYHAKLEFQRRKTALRAMRTHQRCRTDGCTYDEMLDLTNPLLTHDVIQQFGLEQELSRARQKQLVQLAAGQVPWFLTLTAGLTAMGIAAAKFFVVTPSVAVCDPAFVAQVPGSNQLLKIGHFDEVAGVVHVEI